MQKQPNPKRCTKTETGGAICIACERRLTIESFRGYRNNGSASVCWDCGADGKYLRSPESPYLIRPAKPGEVSKHCSPCDRNLPLFGFSVNNAQPDKLASRCKDCEYLQSATGSSYRVVQSGPPLKRAYYRDVHVNGCRMTERYIQ